MILLDILLLPIRFLVWMPKRILRVLLHLWFGITAGKPYAWSAGARPFGSSIRMWWMEWMVLFFDLAGIPEIYEWACRFTKWHTRGLSEEELKIGKAVYGDTVPWFWVRIDQHGQLGPRQMRIAYVSFCTINFWKKLRTDVFVHELMHVWQFHRWGSVYMVRALMAQRTNAGYDYGGVASLRSAKAAGKTLFDFNYEQQADIIADQWRLMNGMKPAWGRGDDIGAYTYFMVAINSER